MRTQLLSLLLPIILIGCTSTSTNRPTTASSPTTSATETPGTAPTTNVSPTTSAAPLKPGDSGVSYKTEFQGSTLVHIVRVANDANVVVQPIVADKLQTVEQFAKSSQAIAAINGGFFDPDNQKTTSYVTINRKTVADPKQNEQLTNNSNLKIYLRQIYDRSEFQRYDCGGQTSYGIQRRSQPVPEGCEVVDAIGGGPQLLPDVQSQREAFIDPGLGRDVIGSRNPNARSAIGITKDNEILLVMVEQTKPDVGMTIAELAGYMKSLGAEVAMNLDGGSSSSLVYNKEAHYGSIKTKEQGSAAVKSAIVVAPK